MPYHWQIGPNRDLTLTPHVYTGVLPAIERQVSRAQQPRRVPGRRVPDLRHDRQDRARPRPSRRRAACAAISTPTADGSSTPTGASPTSLRVATRQDRHAPLRHHQRRPAAQRHQCRADHARQLHLDRRLGVPGAAGRRPAEADPDRAAGDRRALPDRGHRRRAARNRRPTASRSRGSRARTRSAPSPAPMGPAAAHALGSGGDLHRLWPRRRLSHRRCRRTRRSRSTAAPTAGTRERSERSRPTCNGRSSARLFGGVQRLVPRVQLVLTPPTPNLDIPNEDARSVDLEDSNLFALNRFPGYDRWEDASRVTYGLDWSLDRNNVSIDSTIGQSYRFGPLRDIFPHGTGLTGRVSDIVGRTESAMGASSSSRTATASTRTISRSAATRST